MVRCHSVRSFIVVRDGFRMQKKKIRGFLENPRIASDCTGHGLDRMGFTGRVRMELSENGKQGGTG